MIDQPQLPLKKVWGTTTCLVKEPLFEMHRLHVEPKSACSIHFHHHKHNTFYVLKGLLYVVIYDAKKEPVKKFDIYPGSCLTVKAGMIHRFETDKRAADVIESYFIGPLRDDDIHRLQLGSKI